MNPAFICDAIRTPIGRYGGALSSVRTDDLGAIPLRALMARNPGVDWAAVTDVIFGCANQAGEDNRNVARMSSLLAGLPAEVPGATVNRLCGSGLDALGTAARTIKAGEAGLMIAGGVESMSRAPFVMPKAESAFSRSNAVYDTTIGWRFVNKLMKAQYGVDSMPETAENVATDFGIEREAQDRMALASQMKAVAAQKAGHLAREICPVSIAQKKGEALVVDTDEHPRETSLEKLAALKGVVRPDGTVTAGNASGVNDGACALLLADEATAAKNGLTPKARIVGMATAGVAPRIMGIGPAPATQKVLALTGLTLAQMDVIELNEAFAAQGLAVLRMLGLPDDDARVNAWGGAIALGHPLGASGARRQPPARQRRALRPVHHVHRGRTGHRRGAGAGLTDLALITEPFFYAVAVPAVLLLGVSKSGFGAGFGSLAVPLTAWQHIGVDGRPAGVRNEAGEARGGRQQRAQPLRRRRAVGPGRPEQPLGQEQQRDGPDHAGGPPINAYVLPLRLPPLLFTGTMAFFFFFINLSKWLPYAWLGLLDGRNLGTSLVLLPFAPVGVWVGVRIAHRIYPALFYRLVHAGMFLTACKLLWDAWR